MASSENDGQYLVLCQICEEETKLKWKCLDCEMLMCHKCKEKIHPKFKFADDHRIINIKEVGVENQENESTMDFSKIKCIQHPGQLMTLHCESCDQLACAKCIVQLHKKHDLMEICDGYKIKMEKLVQDKYKIQNEKDNLSKTINKLEEVKISKESEYNELNQKILSHESALVCAIQGHSKTLRGELDQKYRTIQKSIDEKIDYVNQLDKEADKKLLKLELQIDTKDAANFFNNLPTEDNKFMDRTYLNWTNIPLPQFVPMVINLSKIGNFCQVPINLSDQGALQTKTMEKIKNNFEMTSSKNLKEMKITPEEGSVQFRFKVKKQYNTQLQCITDIVASPDGSLWICSGPNGMLQKVKPNGNNLDVIFSYNITAFSMALTSNRDLLLLTNEYKIKIIYNDTGNVRNSKYNVAPLYPIRLSVSGYDVFVGASNTEHKTQRVIVIDPRGNHVARFENDVNNYPIFSNIIDLAISNGNIFVVDGITVGFRVLVIRTGAGHIANYQGHPDINSEKRPFAPSKIRTAPSTNVVVHDTSTDTLHILNNDAQLLSSLYLHDTGLPSGSLVSMSFSNENLYVGLYTPYFSCANTILYQLNISGCPELRKKPNK